MGEETGRTGGESTEPSRQRLPPAVNLGLDFAAGIALLTYLGHRLDLHVGGGSRAWTLTGMLLGLAYGAYETWKVVRDPDGQNGPKPP